MALCIYLGAKRPSTRLSSTDSVSVSFHTVYEETQLIFSVGTETWALVEANGAVPRPRWGHSAVVSIKQKY